MQGISDLKVLLLEMLEATVSSGTDIQATQQMGVNMTNAVKRDGVVIIQNQNVEVLARIMPSMVKALKLCDVIDSYREPIEITQIHTPTEAKQLPPPIEEDQDPINECCAWLFENHIPWQGMQDLMKARYLEYVIGQFKTKTEAAKWLEVGSTYLCKLSKTNSVSP